MPQHRERLFLLGARNGVAIPEYPSPITSPAGGRLIPGFTTVTGMGQIEIDEVYVGVDRTGAQYVVPVQAKSGHDQLSVVQTEQDVRCCAQKFPALKCRPVFAQFLADDRIALFELALVDDEIRIVDQRHYVLSSASAITEDDLKRYRNP